MKISRNILWVFFLEAEATIVLVNANSNNLQFYKIRRGSQDVHCLRDSNHRQIVNNILQGVAGEVATIRRHDYLNDRTEVLLGWSNFINQWTELPLQNTNSFAENGPFIPCSAPSRTGAATASKTFGRPLKLESSNIANRRFLLHL